MFLGVLLAASCATTPDARQLDYWLGNWRVGGSGTSAVSTSLDQCVVTERWDTGKGLKGENIFAYSADDKQWHGLYVDNQGRVHILAGTVTSGVATFQGPSLVSDGHPVLNRITIARQGANAVEQTWEKSSDNGATWTVEFRGAYARLLHLHQQ